MNILERLSSPAGDRSEVSNKAVAREALEQPDMLDEVAVGLEWNDHKLVGDCAEVFTEVAKQNPALVAPYVDCIAPLISHRNTRVRWESTHALALVASLAPEQIAPLLPDLVAKIKRDKSVIVRDCAVLALGEYGRSGPEAAREVFPHLLRTLEMWEGKHAKLVLEAMIKLVEVKPGLEAEMRTAAQECLEHRRANVRRLAQRLLLQGVKK